MQGIKKIQSKLKYSIEIVLLLLLAAVFIFPFIWMLSTSLKPLVEAMQFPPSLIPQQIQLQNFAEAWGSSDFLKAAGNSLFVALSILFLQLLVILPASYAFAFKPARWHKFVFAIVMVGLMVPQQITFLPVYLLFSKFNLINTYTPLIIPFVASAFGTFMITQSFKQIPTDVIEAAKLDRASTFKIIWRILLPSVRPTIIVFALFSFITHWNDYFWPYAMTNADNLRTLPMAVANLISMDGIKQWNVIMAGNIILVVPLLMLYVFCNKWIKRAFAYSGIK